jgi:hypothetical protein
MGFMDKVKSAAADVATQAQKATTQAQSKIEQTQLRRKADDVARNLGYAVVRQRTQGVDAAADIDAMVAEITALETQIAAEAAAPTEPSAGPSGAAPQSQAPVEPAPAQPPAQGPPAS